MTYQLDGSRRLILTDDAWSLLRSVNRRGNEIVWTPDQVTWGVEDRWEMPKEVDGHKIEDCDGITLWKMHELMNAGVPPTPLLFTVCRDETGEGHAILCVSTNRGDFILDNRYPDVISYDRVKADGYKILYRSSVGGSLTDLWDAIKENR